MAVSKVSSMTRISKSNTPSPTVSYNFLFSKIFTFFEENMPVFAIRTKKKELLVYDI